jgi:hypothetical protein
MTKLTKKQIFKCKLSNKPVDLWSGLLYDRDNLELLIETGIWVQDLGFEGLEFDTERTYILLYTMRLYDNDTDNVWTVLDIGDRHTVCL